MKGSSAGWAMGFSMLSGVLGAAECAGTAADLVPPTLLPIEAPQGIAIDTTDGSLWIVSAISTTVVHLDRDLHVLGTIEAPFTEFGRQQAGGIAYRPDTDTLLISEPYLPEIQEVTKEGVPTGLSIQLSNLPTPPNLIPRPFVKGLEYDPVGNGGNGSIWLVESVLSALYEISLDGEVLDSFCAPEDPDGCPGAGYAAAVNDINFVSAAVGRAGGFEMTSGLSRRNSLLRTDSAGLFTGYRTSLAGSGGRVGGFTRGRFPDPANGLDRDVLFVTVESSAELHVMIETPPGLLPIEELSCANADGKVRLEWKSYGDYDGVKVFREGALLATLPGPEESFEDPTPPDGVLTYLVAAARAGCESRATCVAVIGAGEVLRAVPFDGYWAVDLAEDAAENLWVTDVRNKIVVFDKSLNEIIAFPGPFTEPGDEQSGIAFNPNAGTMFVYNWKKDVVVEIDDAGDVISGPFPSGVSSAPEDRAAVTAMLFDAQGLGGAGVFWYLEASSSTIQARDRLGGLVSSCAHPDQLAQPTPPGSGLGAVCFGLCEAPGTGFQELYISGGKARDRRTTRILKVNSSCATLEEEIPVEGIQTSGDGYALGLHRSRHNGKDVFYAIDAVPFRSRILELEVRRPIVPFVRDLECKQPAAARSVSITFTNPGGLEAVLIERDGALIATLPGSAASHVDLDPPAGLRRYEVFGEIGGGRGDGRACSLQVGPGSVAALEFAGGISSIHSVAPDPTDGSYVAASSSNTFSDSLYRFDAQLRFLEKIPSPFQLPLQAAAVAIRDAGGLPEILCLGWRPGAPPGTQTELPLVAIDRAGGVRRTEIVKPPTPRGNFVAYPGGLAWDRASDTLWLLERNAFTVAHLDLSGTVLETFPHPFPPHQDGVENFGIAVDPSRGVIYLSSAGQLDLRITRLVEVTRGGQLTGVEIPLAPREGWRALGFALVPDVDEFVVATGASSVWDLVRTRGFDAVKGVRGLSCRLDGLEAVLTWQNGEAYDSVEVYRDRTIAETLPGSSVSWRDPQEAGETSFYRVVGLRGGLSGPGSVCEVDLGSLFVRGDVEENGAINITDAVAILSYLFLGATAPRCLDAADTDDSGGLNISDAIGLLGYLFNAGAPPRPPFPSRGVDPTEDQVGCGK